MKNKNDKQIKRKGLVGRLSEVIAFVLLAFIVISSWYLNSDCKDSVNKDGSVDCFPFSAIYDFAAGAK